MSPQDNGRLTNNHSNNANGNSKNLKPKQLNLPFPADEVTSFVAVKGCGTLASYSLKIAVLEVGTHTPVNSKARSRFKNFGIIAIEDAPVKTYGAGPHFILVELQDKIEEAKVESRSYGKCIHMPAAIIGSSTSKCSQPNWLEKGEWIDAILPKNKQLKRGKLIGIAKLNKDNSFELNFDHASSPITLIAPTLFFESPFQLSNLEEFNSPYTDEASKNWILIVRSIPNKNSRIIHPVRINDNSLIVPKLKFNDLKSYCEINEESDFFTENENPKEELEESSS